MKLLSATVRNYRIHQETTVDFDGALCLIGGPNESGKSTFIEAVHRGLFLKSRVTGDAQKSMVSECHAGHPEVEVAFTAENKTFKLLKRFSGTNGTTTLTEVGGKTLQGDAAESRLNALLQVEDMGGGRNIADRILQQWAHLWVWQGKSGTDPAADVAAEQSALLQRLQDDGGAVAVQSQRDAQIASAFAKRSEDLFTLKDKPRAGSELARAQAAYETALATHEEANARLNRLLQAVQDFEAAEGTIRRCTTDLEALTQRRAVLRSKLDDVGDLEARKKLQEPLAARAAEKLADLNKFNDQIESLQKNLHVLESAIAPQLALCDRARAKFQDQTARAQEANKKFEAAAIATRAIRQRRELARAWVEFFDCKTAHESLEKRSEEVAKVRETLDSLRESLAKLPELDAAALDELRAIKARGDRAKTALDAMASGIEVLASDLAVRIGDMDGIPGSTHTVTESTDFFVGQGVHLRIHPGGGGNLAETREEVRAAKSELLQALDAFGLDSLEHAVATLSQRDEFDTKLEREALRLRDLDDGSLEEACAAAQQALLAAEAEVERRALQFGAAPRPTDRPEALAWRTAEDSALEVADDDEAEAKAEANAANAALAEAERSLQAITAESESQREEISNQQAVLRSLVESHGEDESRRQCLKEFAEASAEAQKKLVEICQLLEVLQPEQLASDDARLERAHRTLESERQAAVEKRATTRAMLNLDGSEDPQAVLQNAEAQLESARIHHESTLRRANAIKLIHQLFEEQKKVLTDRFTQPLVERISDYLRGVFGPAARVVLTVEDTTFKGIQLVRPEQAGAVSFDALSGGTKEQVAAAVRLAIAEVLAANHGNALPVVFDDAFAYSDPKRVQDLQRMLDLAATRGLQVIILSCNPSDYAALGARQTILPLVSKWQP